MRRGRCQRRSTFQTVTDQTVSPAGAPLRAPRCPRGAWPPGSPLLRRRNLMQTHFDRGFLAGLDLPTEKKNSKNTHKKATHTLQKISHVALSSIPWAVVLNLPNVTVL